ncbi:hypothetical protein GWK47_033031 [Chionoecetes opilio]|uniref:Uncharacterized protein n=1 Tax=Chionoecetes opilio TaxID=41210 RepID=A0A8J5D3J2_CHIOP|nr:hypothetical protein GWK47_033031 [Chionoecetes opilio]
MKQHLWYLTAEMIPLALFSEQVPPLDRQAIADALLYIKPLLGEVDAPQNRFGAGWGKPKFPTITASTRLSDLVEVDSWFTIYRLEIDDSFLQLPVAEWGMSAAYIASSENVASVSVINDAAARGVKLSSDFVDTARSDGHFQNVLQVVEEDRKSATNLRKLRKRSNTDALE